MSNDVTVLVPVYNRALLLERCLGSIAAQQTGVDLEVVVVDDCSTDGSAEVARRFGAKVIRTQQNLGPGGARNVGFGEAAGRWIALLDSDDWWCPDHLQTLWDHRDSVGLVASSALTSMGTRLRVVGNPLPRVIQLRRPADVLAPENVIATSASMVKADFVRRVGGFPLRRYAEDLDLWVRVLAHAPGRVLPVLTVAYGSHSGQLTAEAEMVTSSVQFFAELEEQGLLPFRLYRALRTATAWDACRSRSPRWLAEEVRARRIDLDVLGWLLVSRAGQRHRWRLQARRVREMSSVLGRRESA